MSNPNLIPYRKPATGAAVATYPAPEKVLLIKKSETQKQDEIRAYGRVMTPHEALGISLQQEHAAEVARRRKQSVI